QTLLAALLESDAVKSAAALRQRRLQLQISLGNALLWAKGLTAPETSAAFARARELASCVEDRSQRFSADYGLWVGHLNRCEPAPMREIAELFLREATTRPDCPEALVAHRISGLTCFSFGDFTGAHDHFQKTVELCDQARHGDFAARFGQDPRAAAEIIDALTLWVLGRIDEALRLVDRALANAKSVAHAPTMGFALLHAAYLGLVRCNPEAVATSRQVWPYMCPGLALPSFFAGVALFFKGWTRGLRGEGGGGLAKMGGGMGIKREQGFFWHRASLEPPLAEAEAGSGET